jgi:uncharacterized membrane protein (DUF106 family)
VGILNAVLSKLFDLIFFPLGWMGPLWALTVVSVLAGVLMLWVFGKTSNQDAIGAVRDRIRGNMIAIRLYGDNLGVLMRLQGRILRDNAIFMKYAVVPLLVLIVPLVLIIIQLDLRYVARPLAPGERAIVKVTVRNAATLRDGVRLEAPDGVVLETGGVRIPDLFEVAWRVRAESPGQHTLRVIAGEQEVEKELQVGDDWDAVSRKRTGGSLFDKLLHPGESTIGRSDPIRSIEIGYPSRSMRLFGFNINWLVWFFVVSILAGFFLRKPLGVEI